MINPKDINWERLEKPNKYYKILRPDNDSPEARLEFFKKLIKLKRGVLKRYLWISDEFRYEAIVDALIESYFKNPPLNLVYEAGDFQGVLGFMSIYPNYKCNMIFKLVDIKLWGNDFRKASKEIMELMIDEFKLRRITTESPDPRIVRMAEMVGFKVEGKMPDCFMWNEKFHTNYILGKYPKVEEKQCVAEEMSNSKN